MGREGNHPLSWSRENNKEREAGGQDRKGGEDERTRIPKDHMLTNAQLYARFPLDVRARYLKAAHDELQMCEPEQLKTLTTHSIALLKGVATVVEQLDNRSILCLQAPFLGTKLNHWSNHISAGDSGQGGGVSA